MSQAIGRSTKDDIIKGLFTFEKKDYYFDQCKDPHLKSSAPGFKPLKNTIVIRISHTGFRLAGGESILICSK